MSVPVSVPKAAALSPAEITKRSRSSFLLSFAFLRPRRRRGLATIYAWCRAVDDAADDPEDPAEAERQLAFWRAELERIEAVATGAAEPRPTTQTGVALAAVVADFGVEVRDLRAVLEGVAMDVERPRFPTQAALDGYCEKVASAVGLACLPVFGVPRARAERYAHELGLALQITNVLRDLRSDAREGRVYVPQDDLAAHGVDEAWLAGDGPATAYADGGPIDRLVATLAERAESHFAAARAARPTGPERRRLVPAEIMGAIYAELLRLVRARRGRIDDGVRLSVSKRRKLALALGVWLRGER